MVNVNHQQNFILLQREFVGYVEEARKEYKEFMVEHE